MDLLTPTDIVLRTCLQLLFEWSTSRYKSMCNPRQRLPRLVDLTSLIAQPIAPIIEWSTWTRIEDSRNNLTSVRPCFSSRPRPRSRRSLKPWNSDLLWFKGRENSNHFSGDFTCTVVQPNRMSVAQLTSQGLFPNTKFWTLFSFLSYTKILSKIPYKQCRIIHNNLVTNVDGMVLSIYPVYF